MAELLGPDGVQNRDVIDWLGALFSHPTTRDLCRQIGEKELLAPARHEEKFRGAVRAFGYVPPR